MPDTRVLAYFMHEHEQSAAAGMLRNAEITDSYVIGDIDTTQIDALRAKGLVVQDLKPVREAVTADAAPAVDTPGVTAATPPAPRPARRAARGPRAPRVAIDRPMFHVVQMAGPVLPRHRGALDALGVTLKEHIGDRAYVAKLTAAQAAAVESQDFVAEVALYDEAETVLASGAAAEPPAPAAGAVGIRTYDARLHDAAELEPTRTAVAAMGVLISGAKGRKIRFHVLDSVAAATAEAVRALGPIERVDPYVEPTLHNDIARVLIGLDSLANPAIGMTEQGAGQIIAIADTGLDSAHPDFQGRIVEAVALGRPNDSSDPHGHGTHVAGSALGSGAANAGQFRGTAPSAHLYFQSILDANGKLGGLPLDLADLFEQAYQKNARIHNNSWGSVAAAEYMMNSQEVDAFVARRRDMLVVISAGNDGQAANRVNSQPGTVDWQSIGAPASCKNGLTVGASQSNRTSGGYSTLTYGTAWPGHFPDPPIATAKVSGSADGLAGFSSRGPCTDRRVKPDVVAPGTDIVSARSAKAPLQKFWGPGPTAAYAYMGGTSMAAPLVAGCAALVREYYVTSRAHAEPSAALLKATLINSTRKLPGADAVADFDVVPNMHQGFGLIQMPNAYPNPINPQLKLEFLDDWKTPAGLFSMTGQRKRYEIDVAAGMRLSICLTWTDPPGRALQNNLNLLVELPGGGKMTGNHGLPLSLGPIDQENNVEVIRIELPAAGKYLIQISANNLLTASQDFALVVTGAMTSALVPK